MAFQVKDGNGNIRNVPMWDPAFSCSATVAPGAGPTTVIQLASAAGIILRVKFLRITIRSGTAVGTGQIFTINRYSTAASGGTPVTPTICKNNINNAAANGVVTHFTGAPTAGTKVAIFRSLGAICLTATTADAANQQFVYDGTLHGDHPMEIVGTADFMTVDLAAALSAGQSMHYELQWEEASTSSESSGS